MTTPDLSLIFVADGRGLEILSWPLVSSIAAAHDGAAPVQAIAYCSVASEGDLHPVTRALYAACNVEVRALAPPPDWKTPYPHGNKIIAAADLRPSQRTVFLDTDMVCLAPLTEMGGLPDDVVAATPEGTPTWGRDSDRWDRAYAHFGMDMPTDRVILVRGRKIEYVPYFNAGFVAIPDTPDATGQTFGEQWLDTAVEFDRNCSVGGKRPWVDQITIPLTIKRFGYSYRALDDTWNYALTRRKDFADTHACKILHFHLIEHLQEAPQYPAIMAKLFDHLPAKHHDAARDVLREKGFSL